MAPWKPINHALLAQLHPLFPGCWLGCHIQRKGRTHWTNMKKEKNKKNKNKNTQTITKLTAVIYRYCSLNLYPISWPRPALNFRNLHETSAAELCFYFFHFSFFSFWIFKAYGKREIHTHVHALTAGWGLLCWDQRSLGPMLTRFGEGEEADDGVIWPWCMVLPFVGGRTAVASWRR